MSLKLFKRSLARSSARRVLLDSSITWQDRMVLERAFFKYIRLPNGTHKTTSEGRLTDVDELLLSLLPPEAESIRLMDVGISSGITTLELIDHLSSAGYNVNGVGVDISIHAYLRRRLGMDILFDSEGNVLQLATSFVVKGRPYRPLQSVKSLVLQMLIGLLEGLFTRRWAKRLDEAEPVMLITPRLLEHRDFQILEHDITKPLPDRIGRFDLIRAANVLNISYFEPQVLSDVVNGLLPLLKPHGLFLICRTDESDGANHGTIFQKHGTGLRVLHRIGKGSELQPLLKFSECEPVLSPLVAAV